jgi:SAM-dependent methyltransferase
MRGVYEAGAALTVTRNKYCVPAMVTGDSERFWDERAREDAFYFVDNRLRYGDPDVELFWTQGERDLDQILELVDAPAIGPGDVTLDVGCGVGRLSRVLAARGSRVIALDVSAEMLSRARDLNSHLDNVEWLHGDGISLGGVPDASVDAAVSFVVFQHIPDPAITLGYVRELGRVLRPGGWAAFQVSTDPSLHQRRWALSDRLRAWRGRAPRGQSHPAWRGSAVDLDDLRAAADEGGLDLERIERPTPQFCLALARRRG